MRSAPIGAAVLIGGLLVVGCAPIAPATADGARQPSAVTETTSSPSPAPTATPSYRPGPNATGGLVVRRTSTGMVLESVGRETEVDLSSVIDVWKERSVTATAIEIGDDVTVNGTRGPTMFAARYVWVNIGRLDGMILSFDGREMLVAYQRPSTGPREMRVELSPYVEIVRLAAGGERPGDRSDLAIGRAVGMVLYCPRDATPRATRIWLQPGP